jgi:DNA-binding GntR family transcriptional regulator
MHEAPGVRERLDAAHAAMRHACLQRDFEQFQVASLRYTEALHAAAANHYLDYLHAKLYPDLFHKQLATAVHDVDWPRHLAHVDSLHAALCAGDLAQALALVDAHETHMQAIFAGIGTGVPTR